MISTDAINSGNFSCLISLEAILFPFDDPGQILEIDKDNLNYPMKDQIRLQNQKHKI
jgi:hypothetical protein